MTNALLTPWYHRRRRESVVPTADATGGVAETPILDHQARGVRQLTAWARTQDPSNEAELVRQTHAAIGQRVRAVYAMNDEQPSSETLHRGRGSCSQRMAVLESVARGAGIPTRVRGLVLDGRFW